MIFYIFPGRKKKNPRYTDDGFSLLEVLVSLAIVGLTLGLIYEAYASGVSMTTAQDAHTRAHIQAESLIATVDSAWSLSEERIQGEGWAIQVTEEPGYEDLFRIVVQVDWRAGNRTGRVERVTHRLRNEITP
ncbi:type II secretion system protein J [Magnetospira sp. QH-2]|uniref:PulJ/GspJ family protein n=1 Tax=Magnetospira sp. (strain QH-2) TaxID=1288970 RepID=UPI00130E5755|nr:prepilin-type N-terminal cleavage/methylation domain-containing protein [Magnetospira sp. QH-2]